MQKPTQTLKHPRGRMRTNLEEPGPQAHSREAHLQEAERERDQYYDCSRPQGQEALPENPQAHPKRQGPGEDPREESCAECEQPVTPLGKRHEEWIQKDRAGHVVQR